MNDFEKAVVGYIGEENLNKLQSVKVGIGGAGGLGSNCAFNLVRSGFKNFVIVDFDKVEYPNLNRQFYFTEQVSQAKVLALKENLLKINPDLEFEAIVKRVNSDNISQFFDDCDIIVEAFDEVKSKKMIVDEYINSDKFLVFASGLAGWGNTDKIQTKRFNDNFYIVGDFITEVSDDNPPLSPRVNIVAAKQADLILEAVLEGRV
ncbi:thiamine biosynthesis protein ThiF [Orenia metallireducens]|uniref:Thiamine biosynthesis protein ThiF n=1 Tax=Orenia metallireducens TaxID=1413210 RepID=A0A1C0A5Z2_9FIRM|nr:sulfur carrier protein ThiS adenylyltransferase ThiF [Orenia metallireducens]OCL25529.1 thiamine biosynthesis protein ThiF [Orenia metallireducens]